MKNKIYSSLFLPVVVLLDFSLKGSEQTSWLKSIIMNIDRGDIREGQIMPCLCLHHCANDVAISKASSYTEFWIKIKLTSCTAL